MDIQEKLLTPNTYSRPQIALKTVTHIVIHWVGNAATTAIANRNYFESLRTKKRYASSHYIIGLQGEIIRCIPETEIAYHASSANNYSIGIENCHPDWEGKLNSKTYGSLILLCAQLCIKYNLDPEKALLRHYDVTKKMCPRYYVKNEEAWRQLKLDVREALNKLQEDEQLLGAVQGMIVFGISLDLKVWGSVDTMNMKYAKLMVERIGSKFGISSYKATIDFLVGKGCISAREVWDAQLFEPKWCRALLIKVYQKLIKM